MIDEVSENTNYEEVGQVSGDTGQVNNTEAVTPPEVPSDIEETRQSGHFKRLREKTERAERERDELAARLQELESKGQSLPQEDDDFDIDEEDLVDGKHLKKVLARQKALEKELKEYKQQTTQQTAEVSLQAQYPDIQKVLSKENIKALEAQYPELSYSIKSNPDTYTRNVAAYKMMKQLGIYQDDVYVSDKAKAVSNAGKPRPLTSVSPQQGDSPLSRANAFANGLTEELKASLRKEMAEARKNL